MRTILINEIRKERCNAQVLGAFNSAISLGQRTANGMIQRGDEKEAVSNWKSAMVYGVQQTDGKTQKQKEAINSAYAQAIGMHRALNANDEKKKSSGKSEINQKSANKAVSSMSNIEQSKNLDIVQKQMQTILKRGNPKTGILEKDKPAFARLQSREIAYINARGKNSSSKSGGLTANEKTSYNVLTTAIKKARKAGDSSGVVTLTNARKNIAKNAKVRAKFFKI